MLEIYFDLQSQQDNVKKIDDALPQDPDLGKIIYYFHKTAVENGMMVKDLFLSQSAAGSSGANTAANIKDMTFSIDLLGDYPSLENFIISLENSSRIFEVTNISFGSASGPPYSFSLQIKTHSY